MQKLEKMGTVLVDNRRTATDDATDEARLPDPNLTEEERADLAQRKEQLAARTRRLTRACSFRNYQQLAEAINELNTALTLARSLMVVREDDEQDVAVNKAMLEAIKHAESAVDRLDF